MSAVKLLSENLKIGRPSKVKVMVFQPETLPTDWKKNEINELYFPKNKEKFHSFLINALQKAQVENVNLIVFPELFVPEEFIDDIIQWSSTNEIVVIAGSHYHYKDSDTFISRCPIIFNGSIYYTEKINPAPGELSVAAGKGITKGDTIKIFNHTPIGNFAVLICSDNLIDEAKDLIKKEKLDFWFVISFQKNSALHFENISLNIKSNSNSKYIIYCNNKIDSIADGNSSFFGETHEKAMEFFSQNNLTDLKPSQKLISLNEINDHFIVELDIENKRAFNVTKPDASPNVKLLKMDCLIQKITNIKKKNDLSIFDKDSSERVYKSVNLKDSVIESFHKFSLENYLKKSLYNNSDINEEIFSRYSNAFLPVISVNSGTLILEENQIHVFYQISLLIEKSKSDNPLLVNGFSGCGKTFFLSVLYLYMHQKFIDGKSKKIPILISLHHYNKQIYLDKKDLFNQAKNKLENDTKDIFEYIKNSKEKEFVFIIDGVDEFNYLKVELDHYLISKINALNVRTKLIGLRKYRVEDTTSKKNKSYIKNPEVDIELISLRADSPNYCNFIKSLIPIEPNETKKTEAEIESLVHKKIVQFKIEEIDFFLLINLIMGVKSNHGYGKAATLSEFYELYIDENNINLRKSSELAFKMFNDPDNIEVNEKNQHEWWVIQKHQSIRDYLVAYHVANKLINHNPKNKDQFSFVYPHKLNVFCKEIINKDVDSQKKSLKTIIELFEKVDINAQTHFCYLLGRFSNEFIKEKAKDFLLKLKTEVDTKVREEIPFNSVKKLGDDQKKLLLYYRTIYISLSYIGDESASSDYIKQLLHNNYFDNLNRGFHLEYYQDIVFTPDTIHSLKHNDSLNDFPKTFNRLSKKIKNALETRNYYNLFQIELYTLCSLAQHRHAKGNLNDDYKKSISKIIEDTLEKNNNLYTHLTLYLKFICDKLKRGNKFKVASFTNDLYKLKETKRQGWVNRNVNNPESVADHMYFAYIIALIHLPAQIDGHLEYDKQKILNMILIHDIGEAHIGDLTPKEKSDDAKEQEEKYIKYLSLIGTYEGLSSSNNLIKLFSEFTRNDDINSTIAREIDKLENLFQLYIYHNDPKRGKVLGFEKFKEDLIQYIDTPTGRKIMNQIIDFFE